MLPLFEISLKHLELITRLILMVQKQSFQVDTNKIKYIIEIKWREVVMVAKSLVE